jgi:DinB family protein
MSQAYDELIRYIRTARGLEAGGYYGAAKLVWALAYSQEIAASNEQGIPRGADLDHELGVILDTLKAAGRDPTIITALESGREAVRWDTTVTYEDIPAVYASRTTGEIFVGEAPEFTSNNDHVLGLKEFPPIWYFEAMTPEQALEVLSAAGDIVESQIKGLSAEQLLIAPAAGEWNMRQLLGHLMMAQELLAGRVEEMLAEDNPPLEGIAVWAMTEEHDLSPGEILERYRDSRQKLVERLKAIPVSDWWRGGWHSEFGKQTILSQAIYFARHELSHMPQFGQIRRAIPGQSQGV